MGEQKRTQFAMQAYGFAELFNLKVGDQKVAGFRVELSAPEGPSTGGGAQAVQHVKLVPEGEGTVIVAGSANQVERSAEIRTYEYLADLHAQRFKGAGLPIDRATYQSLVGRMQTFFAEQSLRVVLLDAPRPLHATPATAPRAGASPVAMIAVFVGVAAAIAVALFLLLRAKHG
jgi:hypothetical protein